MSKEIRKAIKEVESVIKGELEEETFEVLSGVAFNLDLPSADHLLSIYNNPKKPIDNLKAIKRSKKLIEKNHGDAAWLLLHE